MKASAYWKTVTRDLTDLLDRFLAALEQHSIRFCVVGGQAVNAYADPLVSLDLDVAVAAGQSDALTSALSGMRVERFPHTLNVSQPGSDLRIQVQTDPRYAEFVARAVPRTVLGRRLPVASVGDTLQGKLWAFSDSSRRPSKRQKDLADIARLLEGHPELRERVPESVRALLLGP